MKQKKPVYLILASIASLFLPLIYWQFDANLNFTDVTDPVKPSNDTFPSSLNTTKLPAFVRNDMVSNVFYIAHDVFKYGVCEYQNVCVASNETIIYTTTPKAAEELTKKYKNCSKGNDAFCRCNKRSGVRFLPINNQITFESEPTWLMYQWLPRHHIAHFAFSMIQFHSILLHRDFYTLPNFTTLLFQDNPSPLLPYHRDLLKIVQSTGTLPTLSKIDFLSKTPHRYTPKHDTKTRCFTSLHTSRLSEVYATSHKDLHTFRETAEKALSLSFTPSTCPPPKTLILVRAKSQKGRERRMKNLREVVSLLEELGIMRIDTIDFSGRMSLRRQARVIAEYGLIISSHSSQLANLVFAREGAVVVEVSVVYKRGFRVLGDVAGLKYINSVGHRPDASDRAFVNKLYREKVLGRGCMNVTTDGEVDLNGERCGFTVEERERLKGVDFWVDLVRFEKDLKEGLRWLKERCRGEDSSLWNRIGPK
ncbi:hypothetical protein HDU79_005310 [Rhizoclosmatium sp. JEL0117]|nr:hypothetical protein HDU79_005310 [Rhizoclosmatium sp. JEL0117]